MKRTNGKLAEARFFFEKLKEYYNQPPDIGYYANAFIGAARSVTWVLKAECRDIPGWQEWYDVKKPTEDENKFLKKMNNARIRSQKKESIALRKGSGLLLTYVKNIIEKKIPKVKPQVLS